MDGDWGLYILRRGKEEVIMPTHVDDVVAATNSESLWNEVGHIFTNRGRTLLSRCTYSPTRRLHYISKPGDI